MKNKLPKHRRSMCEQKCTHFGKIHFGNQSLKTVGHSFQKIDHAPNSVFFKLLLLLLDFVKICSLLIIMG